MDKYSYGTSTKSVCTNEQWSPSGQTEPKPRELNSNRGKEEKDTCNGP